MLFFLKRTREIIKMNGVKFRISRISKRWTKKAGPLIRDFASVRIIQPFGCNSWELNVQPFPKVKSGVLNWAGHREK